MSRIPLGRQVGAETESSRHSAVFARALESLRALVLRPEVVLEEVPAPTRLAPHAVALSAEVQTSADTEEDPGCTGRFVLLYDPTAPEPWEGPWRVVTYAKAAMDPEVGGDPLAGEAGWSWLTDALALRTQGFAAEAGTVTAVTSQSFGALSDRAQQVELEIRASWSPVGEAPEGLAQHVLAWGDLMCTLAGLPPLPEGVVPLPGIRR